MHVTSMLRVFPLFIVGFIGTTAATATAQTPGTFTKTGSMSVSRSFHSATLMSGGEVLIAGGSNIPTNTFGSDYVVDSAEVYDPLRGTFRATGRMTAARRLHTATLLADDRILVVGGSNERGVLASAEIFDPATGTFTPTGSLATARQGHTALLLPSGEVLIIGGYGSGAHTYPNLAPAEIYDPVFGTFHLAGDYVGRGGCDFCAPSVLLTDGTVLFPGQEPAQIYDPPSDSFTPGGMMRFELSTAVVLMNGQVLFAGGEDCCGREAASEIYSPDTHTFAVGEAMRSRRVWHALTLLPDGKALATGGETDACFSTYCYFAGSVATAELYDPSTGTFSATGSMGVAREEHAATVLNDGRVLITGGMTFGGIGVFDGSLKTAELYTPEVVIPAPALIPLSGDGQGQGAVFHSGTTDAVTPDDPAHTGEVVTVTCTGLPDSSAIPPQIAIGGRMATVLQVSKPAAGSLVTQVRVRIPTGIAVGDAVRVRLTYFDRASNEVTLAVSE